MTILSSRLLGFPDDARVLIVNCDDFGMDEAVNGAVLDSLDHGIAGSCSLMVPCPAAPDAMRLLRRRPEISFGVHLTLVRDTAGDRWEPRAPRARVPSLLDADGALFTASRRAELFAQARPEEIATEFRAQIDAVADAGLSPTHLDFHCLADGGRADVLDLTMALATEYGLAVRVWLDAGRAKARRRGLPVIDHPFLDSFSLDVEGKAARYAALLRNLPPGLSEWAVHPALPDAAGPGRRVRRTDHGFLTSPRARDIVAEEGIVVIGYRDLQRMWSRT